MKINPVNDYRVEVELCAEELARLGLTFEAMDWADVDTRRALWSLVGMLKEQGVNVSLSGRLLIEAGKLPDGVRLCFTSLPETGKPRLRLKKETPVLRCESRLAAKSAARWLPGDIYADRKRGTYYLLPEGTYAEAALARAAEFGTLRRLPWARAVLEEYCEVQDL
jgi:hypothetical protein